MIKLLRANFSRLFRSLYFRLGMIISVLLNMVAIFNTYYAMKKFPEEFDLSDIPDVSADDVEYLSILISNESCMFNGGIFCMFIVPALIAFFIGTDYSDGTIRNKLMVGHKRSSIYLANLITSISAAEIVLLSGMAASYLTGLIFLKNTYLSAGEIFMFIIVGIFITASMSSICTLLSMVIPSKAGAVAAAVMTSFVMMVSVGSITSELESPEVYDEYTYEHQDTGEVFDLDCPPDEMSPDELHSNGIMVSDIDKLEPIQAENPGYPKGLRRRIYVWIQKATPGCQYISLSEWDEDFNKSSVGWSSVFVAVTASAGIVVFRKRDLK